MDDKLVTSSYGLIHDSKRDAWILTCPVEEWRTFRPPAICADRRMDSRAYRAPSNPGVLAPLVVLVLTIATAALLHALH
jgi:hypothetical protein